MIISNNNQIEFTIKTIYSCHCLDYRDTILALKASGVSNSTMSGASRFQSRTVLGKNDIFLVSIQENGIWNDLLCDFLVFRPVGIIIIKVRIPYKRTKNHSNYYIHILSQYIHK